MCRFLAYYGAPIGLDELLYQPSNSLIHQSYKAREREEPLNGDGFGVGWYSDAQPEPATYVGVRPAWNDRNLRSVAPHIRSGCFFAHVRAASQGGVSETNCHPFTKDRLLFMHNGHVEGFGQIKRALRERLSDPIYSWLEGSTDSEHIFALLLERIAGAELEGPADLLGALRETIAEVESLTAPLELDAPSFMNFVVTDGQCIIATRYVSPAGERPPHTLYHSVGRRFICGQDGTYRMEATDDDSEMAIVLASEKLTDDPEDWRAIPHNHVVIVHRDLGVQVEPV